MLPVGGRGYMGLQQLHQSPLNLCLHVSKVFSAPKVKYKDNVVLWQGETLLVWKLLVSAVCCQWSVNRSMIVSGHCSSQWQRALLQCFTIITVVSEQRQETL